MRTGKEFSANRISTAGCLLGFGLLWLAISLPVFIIALRDRAIVGIIIGGIFTLIGLAVFGYALMMQFTRMRVGKPEILLSNTTLRVGEKFTVSYVHTFARAVEVGEIRLQLIFRETATYQQGTDTRTVTHDHLIAENIEPGGAYRQGSMINQSYEYQIPPDGMHNLDVRRNKLQWLLIMTMSIPKLPDFTEEIELNVIPEMI